MNKPTTDRLLRALDAFAGSVNPGEPVGEAIAQQILLRHPQAAVAWADAAARWWADARDALARSEAA